MVEIDASKTQTKAESATKPAVVEETTTQYLEYLFDDEAEQDWEDEIHSFPGFFDLSIRSRYTKTGISRVSGNLLFGKGQSLNLCFKCSQLGMLRSYLVNTYAISLAKLNLGSVKHFKTPKI